MTDISITPQVYFSGVRYRCFANKTMIEFDNYNDAIKFATEQNAKGVSVQLQLHYWQEITEDHRWFPARNK